MSDKERWIIHMDLDAFFASVEQLLDPALEGQPMVVGGNPQAHGVVSSASYAARRLGVHSAMPVRRALELCPDLIVVSPRHRLYAAYSRRVMAILHRYTPQIEQLSIDEAFLDVTGAQRIWGTPREIAQRIKKEIREEEGLPASFGVASNKLVAKIACDAGKPDGIIVVERGDEAAFLAPRKLEALWGVGQMTAQRMHHHGLYKIGELARLSKERVVALFGDQGRQLWQRARGIDDSPVVTHHQRKSISKEHTFAQDTSSATQLERLLLDMSDQLASALRRHGLVAQTVRLKLRDAAFDTITRQVTLDRPTDQLEQIYEAALSLLHDNWNGFRPVRLIGVAVASLLRDAGYQLALLGDRDRKRIQLSEAVDAIREKFGRGAIKPATLLDERPEDEDEQTG